MRTLLLTVLALPGILHAQTSEPRTNGVMFAFETYADRYGSQLVAAFESIPASRFGYKPTPAQQSVGYIAQHLEGANYGLCQGVGGPAHTLTRKDSLADTVKAQWPKDTLIARLKASLRYCDTVLARLGSVETGLRATLLLAYETDLAEHYSQVASYMRLLGMTPPSALPPAKHTPTALPPSALAAYLGVYELAPDITLTVTVREGSLIGQTTLGGPRRLLPEGTDDFFVDGIDAQVTFVRDGTGAVSGLVLHQFERDRLAKRIR
jgi:Domain of unknown function (DUF3471)